MKEHARTRPKSRLTHLQALHESVHVRSLKCGDRDGLHIASELLQFDTGLSQCQFGPIDVRAGSVDLVQRDHHRRLGLPNHADGFQRLLENALGRVDHEHNDVRSFRAAGSHRLEGSVTGSVDKRHLFRGLQPERKM